MRRRCISRTPQRTPHRTPTRSRHRGLSTPASGATIEQVVLANPRRPLRGRPTDLHPFPDSFFNPRAPRGDRRRWQRTRHPSHAPAPAPPSEPVVRKETPEQRPRSGVALLSVAIFLKVLMRGRSKHRFAETAASTAEEARRAEAAVVAAHHLLTIQLAIDLLEAGNIPQALETLLSVPGTKTRKQKGMEGG